MPTNKQKPLPILGCHASLGSSPGNDAQPACPAGLNQKPDPFFLGSSICEPNQDEKKRV